MSDFCDTVHAYTFIGLKCDFEVDRSGVAFFNSPKRSLENKMTNFQAIQLGSRLVPALFRSIDMSCVH